MSFCFFAGHRWNSSGLCQRCHLRCNHVVTVTEGDRSLARCLDCGVVISNAERAPASVIPNFDRRAETLSHRLRGFVARLFGWDEGPFS
jgi:hypothetical protein